MKTKEYSFYERIKRPLKYCFDKYFCPKYIGLENIPQAPYILAGNYVSIFDISFLMCGIDNQINFIVNEEMFQKLMFSWFLIHIEAFPCGEKLDLMTIRKALLVLKDSGVISIFLNDIKNEKSEIENIATIAKVPIVPFGITGDYKYKSNVCLEIGKPLNPSELDNNQLLENRIKKMIRRNL